MTKTLDTVLDDTPEQAADIVLKEAHHSLHSDSAAPSDAQNDPANLALDQGVSRRDFMKGASLLTGVAIAGVHTQKSQAQAAGVSALSTLPIQLTINGEAKSLSVDPRISLLDLLREQLQMTGSKKGCDHGQCGACTMLVNGNRINSCLALAVSYDGATVTTVEGLAQGDDLHPVQQAFLDHDGFQCGYCTPGQIVSAVGLLSEFKNGSPSFVTDNVTDPAVITLNDAEIRERMSGNICRCGAYPGIVAAVRQAHRQSTPGKA